MNYKGGIIWNGLFCFVLILKKYIYYSFLFVDIVLWFYLNSLRLHVENSPRNILKFNLSSYPHTDKEFTAWRKGKYDVACVYTRDGHLVKEIFNSKIMHKFSFARALIKLKVSLKVYTKSSVINKFSPWNC